MRCRPRRLQASSLERLVIHAQPVLEDPIRVAVVIVIVIESETATRTRITTEIDHLANTVVSAALSRHIYHQRAQGGIGTVAIARLVAVMLYVAHDAMNVIVTARDTDGRTATLNAIENLDRSGRRGVTKSAPAVDVMVIAVGPRLAVIKLMNIVLRRDAMTIVVVVTGTLRPNRRART